MVKMSKPLNEVEDDRGVVMPAGTYSGYVESAEEKVSKSGNEMIEMKVVLTGNEKYDGKVLWYHLVMGLDFSEAAAKRFCTAAGIDTEGRTELKPSDVQGRPLRFVVHHEEYAGEMHPKIRYFIEAEQKSATEQTETSDNDIPF